MDLAGVDEVQRWLRRYSDAIRMEFGQGMALAGFSEDVIIEVQAHVARNMIVWLEEN